MFFFFNDTATTEIYTLSLHDALPICPDNTNEDLEAECLDSVESSFVSNVTVEACYLNKQKDALDTLEAVAAVIKFLEIPYEIGRAHV